MAPPAKTVGTIGVVMIMIGVVTMAIVGDVEEDIDSYGFEELVINKKSGVFTTDFNSSWVIEVMVFFDQDCQNIELEIRDSNNTVVYDDQEFCYQINYGERTTFRHVMNETYTFESNSQVDIIIFTEDDLSEELFAVLGSLSCCFGIILTIGAGIMASSTGRSQVVGMMPNQMGTGIPIHTNVHDQGNFQVTQTYLTQPTIVNERIPKPVTIVDNEVRQEKVEEFAPTKDKKVNFWENVE